MVGKWLARSLNCVGNRHKMTSLNETHWFFTLLFVFSFAIVFGFEILLRNLLSIFLACRMIQLLFTLIIKNLELNTLIQTSYLNHREVRSLLPSKECHYFDPILQTCGFLERPETK